MIHRVWSRLRDRRGMTLAELIVSAGLLGLAMALIGAALPPAARSVQRLEALNEAETVADDLLELVRSDLEAAQGYVKIYADDGDLAGRSGVDRGDTGSAVEFQNGDGFVLVLSAGGCGETQILKAAGTADTTQAAVDPGYLLERWYSGDSRTGTYAYTTGGDLTARAVGMPYPKGAYLGFTVRLAFTAGTGDTVTAAATVLRPDGTELLTDELVIDLRYLDLDSAYRTEVTAADR